MGKVGEGWRKEDGRRKKRKEEEPFPPFPKDQEHLRIFEEEEQSRMLVEERGRGKGRRIRRGRGRGRRKRRGRSGRKRSERDEGEIGLLGLGIGAAPAIRGLFHPYLGDETPRYTQTSLPPEHVRVESHTATRAYTRLVLLPPLSFLVPPPSHTRTHTTGLLHVSRHTVASYRAHTFARGRGRFVHVYTRGRVRFPRQPVAACGERCL